MNKRKLLERILRNYRNVSFTDFVSLVEAFGFVLDRTNGSHHIFKRDGIDALVNIQNVRGEAKPYQIKQFFGLVEMHNLRLEDK